MKSVGGFAFAQNGDELPADLGANPHQRFVHGSERFGAEIGDLFEVPQVEDDLFKCRIQFRKGVVNVAFHRHGPGGWLWVQTLGRMECVSFLNSHFASYTGDLVRGVTRSSHRARPAHVYTGSAKEKQ